jgi:hypothetical protein
MARASLQKEIDGFIGWMREKGMLDRWEARRGMKNVARDCRKLKKRIREEKEAREIRAYLKG